MECASEGGFKVCYFTTACKLHTLTVGVQVFTSSYFGQGTGPVLFTGLSCTGTEYSLTDCTQSSSSYNQYHSSDIGVHCLQKGKINIHI